MIQTVRILSIDGGGTLGLIPLMVLEYLENKIGKPIAECFHMIAGTSTGALSGGTVMPSPSVP